MRRAGAQAVDAARAWERILTSPAIGTIDPGAIGRGARRLRASRAILIEGGAHTVSRFLEAGRLDRLHVLVAPLLIGSGQAGLSLAPIARLGEALRPRTRAYLLEDGDVLFDCDLRDEGARDG